MPFVAFNPGSGACAEIEDTPGSERGFEEDDGFSPQQRCAQRDLRPATKKVQGTPKVRHTSTATCVGG